MNITTRTAALTSLMLLGTPFVSSPASGVASDPPWFCTQSVDTTRLPRTPDAVEGWFAQCANASDPSVKLPGKAAGGAAASGCVRPADIPLTADAAAAWLDQRR